MIKVWTLVLPYIWKYGRLILESVLKAENAYVSGESKKAYVMKILKDAVEETEETYDDQVIYVLDSLVEFLVAILHKRKVI